MLEELLAPWAQAILRPLPASLLASVWLPGIGPSICPHTATRRLNGTNLVRVSWMCSNFDRGHDLFCFQSETGHDMWTVPQVHAIRMPVKTTGKCTVSSGNMVESKP